MTKVAFIIKYFKLISSNGSLQWKKCLSTKYVFTMQMISGYDILVLKKVS